MREEARGLLIRGIDPSQQRKIEKLQGIKEGDNTFQAVAEGWLETKKLKWSEVYQGKVKRILKRNLYPWIGPLPIVQITPPILPDALRKTEKEGKYKTTITAKQLAGQIFRYGVATGCTERDPTPDLKGALITPKTTHRAATVDPEGAGLLLLAIEAYEGTPEVCSTLRLAPLTFVRPGELRHAEWSEIDWEGGNG